MNISEIITEASPVNFNFYINSKGHLIDKATGKPVTASFVLEKLKPSEAKKLKALVSKDFVNSAFNRAFGWILKPILNFAPTAIEWAYEMSSINFLFDSGLIGSSGQYNAGEVAQQMRTAVTKKYIAQLVGIFGTLASLAVLTSVAKTTDSTKIVSFLEYLRGTGKTGILKTLSAVAFQTILFVIFSNENVRMWIVVNILESIWPRLWGNISNIVGAAGGITIPATIAPVVDQAIEKGKKELGISTKPSLNNNSPIGDKDVELHQKSRLRF